MTISEKELDDLFAGVAEGDSTIVPEGEESITIPEVGNISETPFETVLTTGASVAGALPKVGTRLAAEATGIPALKTAGQVLETGASAVGSTLDDIFLRDRKLDAPLLLENTGRAIALQMGTEGAVNLIKRAKNLPQNIKDAVGLTTDSLETIETKLAKDFNLLTDAEGRTIRDLETKMFDGEEIFTGAERSLRGRPFKGAEAEALSKRAKELAVDLGIPEQSKLVERNMKIQRKFREALSNNEINLPLFQDSIKAMAEKNLAVISKNLDAAQEALTKEVGKVANESVSVRNFVNKYTQGESARNIKRQLGVGKANDLTQALAQFSDPRTGTSTPEQLDDLMLTLKDKFDGDANALRVLYDDIAPTLQDSLTSSAQLNPKVAGFVDAFGQAVERRGDDIRTLQSGGADILNKIGTGKADITQIFKDTETLEEVVNVLGANSPQAFALPEVLRQTVAQVSVDDATGAVTEQGLRRALNVIDPDVIRQVAGDDYLDDLKLIGLGLTATDAAEGVGQIGVRSAGRVPSAESLSAAAGEAGFNVARTALPATPLPAISEQKKLGLNTFKRMFRTDKNLLEAAMATETPTVRRFMAQVIKEGELTPSAYTAYKIAARELGVKPTPLFLLQEELRPNAVDIEALDALFDEEENAQDN